MVSTDLPFRRLFIAVLLVTMSTQPVFIVGAAFFQIGPEFGLGTDGLGMLTALFFLAAATTSPGLGRWVQRVGWRTAAKVNAIASGTLMISTVWAARSSRSLVVLLMTSAAVYGMANPAANAALAEVSLPGRGATLFGIKHAGIPGSTLIAGALVPLVVLTHGWRWAFGVGAALAAAVWLLVFCEPNVTSVADRRVDERGPELTIAFLVGLGLASALASWAATGLGTFLVSAALDRGLGEASAGWLLTAGSLVSIVARIVTGRVTDRLHLSAAVGLMTLMAAGSIVFFLLPYGSRSVFVALVILAFATGWAWPGLMTFAVVNANPSSVASSSAITQAGVFVGAGVGPFVLGQVATRWSFDALWMVVGGALAIATVLVSILRSAARRSR